MEDEAKHRSLIEKACSSEGLTIRGWYADEDEGRIAADLGRGRVLEDDEDEGLFEGDTGKLSCMVVGAAEHGSERVSFAFLTEGAGSPVEVREPSSVEPI